MPTDAVRPRTAVLAEVGLMPTLAAVGSTATPPVTDRMAVLAATPRIPTLAMSVWTVEAGAEDQCRTHLRMSNRPAAISRLHKEDAGAVGVR